MNRIHWGRPPATLATRLFLGLTVALFVSGLSIAQDEPRAKSAAEKKYEAILTDLEADMTKARDAERKKIDDWKEAAARAKEAGESPPAMPMMRMGPPPELADKYVARMGKAAAEYAGTDDAIRFLSFIASLGGLSKDKAAILRACETLTTDHLASPELADALPALNRAIRVIGNEDYLRMLHRVETKSPNAVVRASAILARVSVHLGEAPLDSKEYRDAKAEAQRAAKIAQDPAIDRRVQEAIDAREKLVAGTVASDIVGVDLDGKPFKLSDYKGKVILLDFWGDW